MNDVLDASLRDSGIIIQPCWGSLYRTCRDNVKGLEQQQSLEQHLDKVWLDA